MRSRPEGRAHREWIRERITPHLSVGRMVPPSWLIASRLGISQQEAAKHMRAVLNQDGFKVKRSSVGEGVRNVVTISPIDGLSSQRYEAGR